MLNKTVGDTDKRFTVLCILPAFTHSITPFRSTRYAVGVLYPCWCHCRDNGKKYMVIKKLNFKQEWDGKNIVGFPTKNSIFN